VEEEHRLERAGQPPDHWVAEAYDALGPDLCRYALMILADASLAEDAVQQAFTRLLRRGRLDDVRSAKAFVRVMVRNEAYRLLAQQQPTQQVTDEPASLLESVDASLERGDEKHQLDRAMLRLTPEQREVVHLKVYEQLTFAQIAELLGIPQNTAASRYRLALERLRQMLSRVER
jgi:RNA polymerase sigma-70 factor, ECF subfamily